MPENNFKIALAGFGNVGTGVFKNINENQNLLEKRTSRKFIISKIAVRDLLKKRLSSVSKDIFTDNLDDLLEDDSINLIVELIGGIDTAFDFIEKSLNKGKDVVTGNKALLAERGKEIFEIAKKNDKQIYYEASVGGGIPIVKSLQESLVGNKINYIFGIINGTCNYILTKMDENNVDYEEALRSASKLGYAEADPYLDVSGWDTAHKAIILAFISYGKWISHKLVHVEGIDKISKEDIKFSKKLGYNIKLLSVIRLNEDDSIELRVQPSLIPVSSILSSVKGVFNAILVNGNVSGTNLFYGSGAGQDPTSSSVISDISAASCNLSNNTHISEYDIYGDLISIEDTISKYYIRIEVEDTPGVLAQIAKILGELNIGILSVMQPEKSVDKDFASIVLMLHYAKFGIVKQAIDKINKLKFVKKKPTLLRVENIN